MVLNEKVGVKSEKQQVLFVMPMMRINEHFVQQLDDGTNIDVFILQQETYTAQHKHYGEVEFMEQELQKQLIFKVGSGIEESKTVESKKDISQFHNYIKSIGDSIKQQYLSTLDTEELKEEFNDSLKDLDDQVISSYCPNNDPFSKKFEDFELICMVGDGSFGKVYYAQLKEDPTKVYAIKRINKYDVEKKKGEYFSKLVEQEFKLLLNMKHPFLISLKYVY